MPPIASADELANEFENRKPAVLRWLAGGGPGFRPSGEDAADAVQEAFVALLLSLRQGTVLDSERFPGLLKDKSMKCAIDPFRKLRGRKRLKPFFGKGALIGMSVQDIVDSYNATVTPRKQIPDTARIRINKKSAERADTLKAGDVCRIEWTLRAFVEALDGRNVDVASNSGVVLEEKDESPEDAVIRKDISATKKEHLKECWKRLTPEEDTVLALKYINGLTYQAIAELLGMKYFDVNNTISRAKQKLRECVRTKGMPEGVKS